MKKLLTTLLLLSMAGQYSRAGNDVISHKVNGLLYKVEAYSDNIFRVRISDNENLQESLMDRYGLLASYCDTTATDISETAETIILSSGKYSMIIDKIKGCISLKNRTGSEIIGKITFKQAGSDECRHMAEIVNARYSGLSVRRNGGIIGDDDGSLSEKDKTEAGDPEKSSMISISLHKDERFYGGGNTSREHIQHRGEMLRMWATYQMTEIPMPFMMSSEGWGIYNNFTGKSYFDVGCTDSDIFNIYNNCKNADFFIMAGNRMTDVLNNYTAVTGRNYLLPKWAYGLCFGPNMKEDQWDILNDAIKFREDGIGCDVFWLEPQWMAKHYDFSTSKKWNYDKFTPEYFFREHKYPKQYYPSLFIGRLNDLGYHLGLWVCEEYDLSIEEEDRIVATGPGKEHWMDHLKTFVDMGVEGFKLDPARTLDEHTYRKYQNGRSDKEMHNLNQTLLLKQMSLMYREHTGKRGWYHYCGGWTGVQHWGASTSGDNGGGKTALFDQLNLANSAYMNTSCDVMFVPYEQQMQSLHFGAFLPWLQINSWCSMFHPFYYNQKDRDIYRKYVELRYKLIPYIYSAAIEGTLTGMPIVRSMPLCFPDDRNVDDMWTQYMFGENLCVGVFSDEIYLPEGEWYDAWTNERIVSEGKIIQRDYPQDKAGLLFIKSGAIIPMSETMTKIGTEPYSSFIVKVYPNEESSYTLYDCDAESYGYENGLISATVFKCRKEGDSILLTVDGARGTFENMPLSRSFKFEIHAEKKPKSVSVNDRCLKGWNWSNGVLTFDAGNIKTTEKLFIKVK